MRERSRSLAVLSGLFCVAIVVPAQQPANPATIQVTSRIVYVDVVVRDASGHVVHGLTQEDFKLSEDGKPQKVDYFSEHVYNPALPPSTPVSKVEFSNVSAPGESSAATVLLFDLLNTPTSNQMVARGQMLKFLGELPAGQRVSLFVLTDHLQTIQSYTGRPELLTAAAKMLKPFDLGHMPSREQVQIDSDTAREFDRQARAIGGQTAMDANVQSQDSDLGLRTRMTLAALSQLAQMMGGYQGRKNLFWVSESFPIALTTTQNYLGQTMSVDARKMTNVLANARIAVYPVSVLGLDEGVSVVAFSGEQPDPKVQYMAQYMARGILKNSMKEIAEQTGGGAIVGTNDLAGAMRRNLEDGSNYYTLAYQPQNEKWDNKFRSIRVELKENGRSLTYWRGYFAYPDKPAAEDPVRTLDVALQPPTPETSMLGLRSKIDLPDAQHGTVLVHSVLNAANLDLAAGADGHRRGQLLVMLIAFRDDPRKAGNQPDALPQTSGVLNLDFDPAEYQAILNNGVAFTQQLVLPPGRYRLRLGVSDETSHRLGTLDMPVEMVAVVAKQ